MTERLRALGLALILLPAVFWPLERLFSARKAQGWIRPRLLTDLAFMAGQYLVWAALSLWLLVQLDGVLEGLVPTALRTFVARWPWFAQALVAVLLADVSVYWFHVASHRVPWLWRFHSIHHSSRELDWVAAHREHPVDGFLTQVAINLPAMVMGVDLRLLAWLVAFRGLWAIFIHSNVKLPLGPLRWMFGAPELHHWHHLETASTQHNFANLAPWTDLLFGTYFVPPDEETWALGNPGEPVRGYLEHLTSPFRGLFPRRHKAVLVAAALLVAAPARAVDFSLNVGALEVVLLPPAHGGFYPYVGGGLAVPLPQHFTFLASLSVEWSFDQGRGGLVVVTTLDYQVAEHLGVDLNVAFIHDQPGLRFAESEFFLGAGPGVSVLIGKWSLSPFLNFFGGLKTAGASIVPGLNVAYTF